MKQKTKEYKYDYPSMAYPPYSSDTYKHYVEVIKKVCEEKFKTSKITFACRGSSGMFLAAKCQSVIPNSKILYVRKKDESRHGSPIEGNKENDVIIIVDDITSSGKTIRAIVRGLIEREITYNKIGLAVKYSEVDNYKETYGVHFDFIVI